MNHDTPILTVGDLVDAMLTHRRNQSAWHRERTAAKVADAFLTRSGVELVVDMLHAAMDPDVRTPGALPHHHHTITITDGCQECAAREKRISDGPEHVTRCQKCGRMLETGITHACKHDQGGMPAAAKALIEAQKPHLDEIKQLRQALENNPDDPDFANETHDRIAVLQATIRDLAAEVTA